MKLEKQRAKLREIKANIEFKLVAAKEKDDIILQKARKKLEVFEKHAFDKATSLKQRVKEMEAELATKASAVGQKVKDRAEEEYKGPRLTAAKERGAIILEKARKKLGVFERRALDKATSFKDRVKRLEAKLAAKASKRERKAKSKVEKEERKLAELEGK